ncbi:FAD-dependent oxidase, partial [Pseudomonas syringae pv. atrofaciens]
VVGLSMPLPLFDRNQGNVLAASRRADQSRDLRNAVELYPPLAGAQAIRTWSGTEGYLPDREPVLGPSLTRPGLLHGFGFAGAGFQIGPAAGEALAEWVCDGASRISLDAFSINRFQQIALQPPAIEPVTNVIPLHRGRSSL